MEECKDKDNEWDDQDQLDKIRIQGPSTFPLFLINIKDMKK